ncbi:MAG: glycosyltransferase [Patescibacteria group bacterium]
MTATLITTVYNEEKNITDFLASIAGQSKLPDEVVIVDAASTDRTYALITDFSAMHPELHLKLIKKAGNRSVGRNTAILNSLSPIIACTDAGCRLDKDWFRNITRPFESGNAEVVSGWYETVKNNSWDISLSKVLNFSPKNVRPESFLPSTRSIAFTKTVWEKAGGFDERLSHNEDTPFALELHKSTSRFVFASDAVVRWHVPHNYSTLYRSIYRYALGDGQSGVYSSQYWILLSFWLMLIACLSIGFPIHAFWIFGIIIVLGYLYLPVIQAKRLDSVHELLLIPLQKCTIILANTAGFIKGLFTKI